MTATVTRRLALSERDQVRINTAHNNTDDAVLRLEQESDEREQENVAARKRITVLERSVDELTEALQELTDRVQALEDA